MKTFGKIAGAAIILATLSAPTMAYADSTGTVSTTSTASTTNSVSATTRFETEYQANQATEATLLQQAQQVQFSDSAQYSGIVTGIQSQVTALYAAEQVLTQLGVAWESTIKGGIASGLVKEEQALELRLKSSIAATHKSKVQAGGRGKGNTRVEKANLAKARAEIAVLGKDLKQIDLHIRVLDRLRGNSNAKSFAQNVTGLRRTILGLQLDEILITKRWIAAEQATVTGTVYGTQTTVGSSVVVVSGSN